MIDGFNRTIDYVRLSVTDRCNLRCRYCMPPDGISCLPMREILTYEEIEHLCRIFADLGTIKSRYPGRSIRPEEYMPSGSSDQADPPH